MWTLRRNYWKLNKSRNYVHPCLTYSRLYSNDATSDGSVLIKRRLALWDEEVERQEKNKFEMLVSLFIILFQLSAK